MEAWLRPGGTDQTSLTSDDVADAIRECLARGELERSKTLLGRNGGTLKNGAERHFLGRVGEQASLSEAGGIEAARPC